MDVGEGCSEGLHRAGAAHLSPASFRDPSGFIFTRDGVLYRQVNQAYAPHYRQLMESGLYAELVRRGWLVAHAEVDVAAPEPAVAWKVLQPKRIATISYPYEWAFSQLRDAALLTLDMQLLAMDHEMSLKDASAYNIQFDGGQFDGGQFDGGQIDGCKPVMIDTLSFEPYKEGQPWVGYRQFCQHFLAPLALMARTDIRLNALLRTYIDGIPLDLASKLLPRGTRWQPGLAMHIHLHARTQRAYASTEGAKPKRTVKVSRIGLTGILQSLRKLVTRLQWQPAGTEWGDYYNATNYSDAAFDRKRELVEAYLRQVQPQSVWDLGANTGVFSRIASGTGASTVAFDIDPAAVESNYRVAREHDGKQPLPLLLDLTNPSPGLGWAGAERDSLQARGPVDCAMALALVHHLAISNNVPLDRVAKYLASLCNHLIIEFVPKSDSQVRRLLSTREDIFTHYDKAHFEAAFALCFDLVRAEEIAGTERTLYLMRKR